MSDEIAVVIITGLFGIVSGALIAYVGAVLKFRKDLEAEYDKDLRSKRIEGYKELWQQLQLLAKYDLPKPLNIQTSQELTVSMRTWYFEAGGLYLSEDTRAFYFDLKRTIKEIFDSKKYQENELLVETDSAGLLIKQVYYVQV
jgi:hypothetical protein